LTRVIACFSLSRNDAEYQAMAIDYTVGDMVAEFLSACGVTTAFGIAAVHNIPMLDAIGRRNTIADLQRPDLGRLAAVSDIPFFKVDRAEAFGETVSQALAVKGLTLVEVDMTAVGEFPPYYPFNQRSA
jgi:thiamine pyrophosphate-dependent acetolactate synthase large subunit-like protein